MTPWLVMALLPPSSTYKAWRYFVGEFETLDKAKAKAERFCGETGMYDIINLVTGERK